ncbi:hypothetical protein VT84_05115 [Gemmata sp. SH-PL17]|uniref:hypothetical protein n=1 Tax=Gemmata sp. SH-PL17 TaxID=1630693 RepID=UPI0004B92B94|nr:hypothetical protein [Gemmata sp. SH-PL17]AMV23770.1 hypothetical protein VT84_05115 [Gemmata sp. SH-PL17]
MDQKPEPRPRGLSCARCRGSLQVYRTTKPTADLVVRYRRCKTCGTRTVSEERMIRTLPGPDDKVHVQI